MIAEQIHGPKETGMLMWRYELKDSRLSTKLVTIRRDMTHNGIDCSCIDVRGLRLNTLYWSNEPIRQPQSAVILDALNAWERFNAQQSKLST